MNTSILVAVDLMRNVFQREIIGPGIRLKDGIEHIKIALMIIRFVSAPITVTTFDCCSCLSYL